MADGSETLTPETPAKPVEGADVLEWRNQVKTELQETKQSLKDLHQQISDLASKPHPDTSKLAEAQSRLTELEAEITRLTAELAEANKAKVETPSPQTPTPLATPTSQPDPVNPSGGGDLPAAKTGPRKVRGKDWF